MAIWGSPQDIVEFYRSTTEDRRRTMKALAMMCLLTWSIYMLGASSWLPDTDCTGVLRWPMVAIGVFLLVFLVTSVCVIAPTNDTPDSLEGCFCLSKVIVTPLVLTFLIFSTVAVGGLDFRGDEVREYKLRDCGGWLKGQVRHTEYWAKLSGCVRDRKPCDGMAPLARDPETGIFIPALNDGRKISPIQSGCCKPPSSCGFTYVNETLWIPTTGGSAAFTDADCGRWSNDKQMLCFQCDSCKAGVIIENKKAWTRPALLIIIVVLIPAILVCFCF